MWLSEAQTARGGPIGQVTLSPLNTPGPVSVRPLSTEYPRTGQCQTPIALTGHIGQ